MDSCRSRKVLVAVAGSLVALASQLPAQLQFKELRALLSADEWSGSWVAVAGDVDGDGWPDLFLSNTSLPYYLWGQNELYLNDGFGGFSDVTSTHLPAKIQTTLSAALGDVDGDGDLDLVLGNKGSNNELLRNDGQGHFTLVPVTASGLGGGRQTRALVLVDLDADGDLDIFEGNSGQDHLLLNDGTGLFRDVTSTHVPLRNFYDDTWDVAAGDLDGDGDLDLVLGNMDAARSVGEQNRVFLNDGAARFSEGGGLPAIARTTSALALGDIDADGDLDLYVGNLRGASSLYLNDGAGIFTDVTASRIPRSSPTAVSDAQMVDVDLDADLDIIVGTYYGNSLLLNDGSGLFADGSSRLPSAAPLSFPVADLDGDGDQDLVATGPFYPTRARVLTNLHRQLNVLSPTRIGGSLTLELYSTPGYGLAQTENAIPWLGFGLLPRPLQLGSLGTLYLDPARIVGLPLTAILPATGMATLTLPVPNDPRLVGLRMYAQAGFIVPVPLDRHFSNPVRVTVSR